MQENHNLMTVNESLTNMVANSNIWERQQQIKSAITKKFAECLLPFSSEYLALLVISKNLTKITLPVIWYGCETWYFTLMGEHRLRERLEKNA
jgi:hypothetical protein